MSSMIREFLKGPASIILLCLSIFGGILAISLTPREEEPQIVVPMADIFIEVPGASPEEVRNQAVSRLERLLWQIQDVEHVYSQSMRDKGVVTVRFEVGTDLEQALVRLFSRLESHLDQVAPRISRWLVKPVGIEDVPVFVMHLHSKTLSRAELTRLAQEARFRMSSVPGLSRIELHGEQLTHYMVRPDPMKLRARGITFMELAQELGKADHSATPGYSQSQGQLIQIQAGPQFTDIYALGQSIVGYELEKPIRLEDVAEIEVGSPEVQSLHRLSDQNSVALSFGKKQGINAVSLTDKLGKSLQEVMSDILPADANYTISRDSGAVADEKVDELLLSLLAAVLTVSALLMMALGYKEALLVAICIPVAFSLSLLVNYMAGYTLNRVTLFALILSLGLVVDDPIVNVENIRRHLRNSKGLGDKTSIIIQAIEEILTPVLISTATIVVSFLPMFFITGMMGPYMRPMAINVPLTVIFSTVCALTFLPFLSMKFLSTSQPESSNQVPVKASKAASYYQWFLKQLITKNTWKGGFILTLLLLMLGCGTLVLYRQVPLKLLPFSNHNDFLVLITLPEGTPLSSTDKIVQEVERALWLEPEAIRLQTYIGSSAPMDFNGLVRHTYLRNQQNQAEIRVDLRHYSSRRIQSHDIVLRTRERLLKHLAHIEGLELELLETPPGPPVLATLTAELNYPDSASASEVQKVAEELKMRLGLHEGVVDMRILPPPTTSVSQFKLNRDLAALRGVGPQQVHQELQAILQGTVSGSMHFDKERDPVEVKIEPSFMNRNPPDKLLDFPVRVNPQEVAPIRELGIFVAVKPSPSIMQKDLKPVIFITAEVAHRTPVEVLLDFYLKNRDWQLPKGFELRFSGEGEWKITLDVFRDLGIAWGIAQVGIYAILVLQTSSFLLPLIIMLAIPLTAIGVIPGFFLLNLGSPVFFTATAMIGMIALGGIVVRNSVVLIEFADQQVALGTSLLEASLNAGIVRMQPILLTAGTTLLSAWPITMDPVFSGLAWALIFGLLASTVFTLFVIPLTYYHFRKGWS